MAEQSTSDERTLAIELIAQTLAPRLFAMFGTPPEEMGFPIYDTKEEVDRHLERQFNPVEHWTNEGREIGAAIFRILEAGGANLSALDIQAAIDASRTERPDMTAEGQADEQPSA